MAKISKGIFGPVSGKLGPVIGGTWKGIPYLRMESQKPKSKRTPGQIATQEKLRFINDFLIPFHSYINVGFMHQAKQKTEISVAFSVNYNQAFVGLYPDLSVDYSKFVLSAGSLPMIIDITVSLIDSGKIKLTWTQNNNRITSFDDQLMLVLYCPELQITDGFVGGVNRSAKKCIFEFNPKFQGKLLEVYASITSIDRKRIANSVYLGRIG